MAEARLTFCGAARGVTGSCYHLAVGGHELVIDCGIFQGDRDSDALNERPFPFDPARLDALILTHGHLDHVGRAPRLATAGFRGEVIGHAATLEIARLIMEDSAKIAQHRRGPPLYDFDDVAALAKRMSPVGGYLERRQVGPFTVELFDAGHIIGSSSVRIAWDDKAILFSGDIGAPGTPIIADPNLEWDADRDVVDWVVTESTYGDKLHPPRDQARETFRKIVRRALADGGKVLIPAFAIGRTQDVLHELNGMVERGELPKIPVIVDGPLGLSATRIYKAHRACWDADALALLERGDHPLEIDRMVIAKDAQASRRAVRIDGPAIVIAGSGMCQGGRIRHHLVEHLSDPRTDVILVGYQARRTLGRALQDGAQEVRIGDDLVEVRGKVTTIGGFSAHGDRDALAAWHAGIPKRPGATTFVTHGEPEVSEFYADFLAKEQGAKTHVPALFDTVALV